MNIGWIERTQKTIDRLQKIKKKRDVDRLDIVKSMRFSFGALSQSLGGWMQWVNSPEIMSQFTREELLEMSDQLIDMTTKFVQYDRDITEYGMKKGLGKQREESPAQSYDCKSFPCSNISLTFGEFESEEPRYKSYARRKKKTQITPITIIERKRYGQKHAAR